MPIPVKTSHKSLEDYRKIIGDKKIDEILKLADPLKGARVLHLNATAFGGGVAELLNGIVPLMNELGINTYWQAMDGSEDFFNYTKMLHNGLQGMPVSWSSHMGKVWGAVNQANAEALTGSYDFIIVHDPQPAGLLHYLRDQDHSKIGAGKSKWIWRCHLDTTAATPQVWEFLHPYIEIYDAVIFTRQEYVRPDIKNPSIYLIPPAIDPLSLKNNALKKERIRGILDRYGIDGTRPIISQVSRFDPWKDPWGVIDVYKDLKQHRAGLQLLMIGSMADDDPEGWDIYRQLQEKAKGDNDIHFLTNLDGVSDIQVNAFQRASDVILQKSTREGFGLVVSEGLWKEKPMVAGAVGGITMQIIDGECGFLANSNSEYVDKVERLLDSPQLASQMGSQGKQRVLDNFLITRLLRDHLNLIGSL